MSSLRSASSLVQQHYSRLEGEGHRKGEGEGHRKGAELQDLESGSETSDLEPRGTDSCSLPGDGPQSMLHQSTSGEGDDEGEGLQEDRAIQDKEEESVVRQDGGPRDNEGEGLQEDQALEDKKEESIVHQDGGPSEVEKRHCEEMLTVHSAVAQMLEFVLPFVEEIHQQFCSVKVVCDSYMCHSVKMEKDFSGTNFEIQKSCRCFNWMLQSSSG